MSLDLNCTFGELSDKYVEEDSKKSENKEFDNKLIKALFTLIPPEKFGEYFDNMINEYKETGTYQDKFHIEVDNDLIEELGLVNNNIERSTLLLNKVMSNGHMLLDCLEKGFFRKKNENYNNKGNP